MHPDHVGMAGWITRRTGCRLWMTRLEYLTCRVLVADTGRDAPEDGTRFYRRAGWDDDALEHYRARFGEFGKSTYARCGIIVNVTPLEPEWEGHVTLEFSNTTPLPAKIYAGEGCAQVLFFESDEVCETSYKDRGGKYQGQSGVTLPRA